MTVLLYNFLHFKQAVSDCTVRALHGCAVTLDTDCSAAGELWFPEQPPPCHQGHVGDY